MIHRNYMDKFLSEKSDLRVVRWKSPNQSQISVLEKIAEFLKIKHGEDSDGSWYAAGSSLEVQKFMKLVRAELPVLAKSVVKRRGRL